MGFQASRPGNSNSRFRLRGIFSARRRSCWNVCFQPCLSVGQTFCQPGRMGGGEFPMWPLPSEPHYTGIPRHGLPLWIWDPTVQGPASPSGPCWWYLFTWGPFSQLMLISGGYWSTYSWQAGGTHPYCNAYLFDIYWARHKNYLTASIKITGDRLYFLQPTFFNWIWLASLYFAIF